MLLSSVYACKFLTYTVCLDQIIYIDRLASSRANLNLIPNACRLRVWDQENVDRALKSDQGPNDDYGFGNVVEDFVYGDI